LLDAEGKYCDRAKSLFGNNSGKPEAIGTKYYRKTSPQVARFPANFWHPPPNERKMAAKNAFSELFGQQKSIVSQASRWPISVKFEHKT